MVIQTIAFKNVEELLPQFSLFETVFIKIVSFEPLQLQLFFILYFQFAVQGFELKLSQPLNTQQNRKLKPKFKKQF